jgi:hypothetical protein
MGNLAAYLLLENTRIPLQLSTKDGIRFEASVRTRSGVEEPASLLIENAWDLAGNRSVENVLPLKVDTIPPKVENAGLKKAEESSQREKFKKTCRCCGLPQINHLTESLSPELPKEGRKSSSPVWDGSG